MKTVPTAMTWPLGRSAGSLHVSGHVAMARRHLAVDLDRRAAQFDRRFVRWRLLKSRARRCRDVRRRVVRRAVYGRGGQPHDVHVAAQIAVDDPGERVRQRLSARAAEAWHHDNVRIDGDDLVALFGCGLAHCSASPQLILTVAPLMFMVLLAVTSMPAPASILVSAEDVISIFCASSLIVPCAAESVMSLSAVIVMVFLAVSKTMLFFCALVDDLDRLFAVLVVEPDDVPTARFDDAQIDSCRRRWWPAAPPGRSRAPRGRKGNAHRRARRPPAPRPPLPAGNICRLCQPLARRCAPNGSRLPR